MLIGTTMLQQILIGAAIFAVSLLLLAILQMLLAGNTATGLGYLKSLCPMFLTVGVLWVALATAVRLLI
jgi:hypothetical protein